VRRWIGALALIAVVVACAACSGGSDTAAGPSAAAASKVPAVCVNVASLRTTVQQLTSMKPDVAGLVAVRLAANNVFTQAASFVSAAPTELRQHAKALKASVDAVRSAAVKAGAGATDVAAAIAGVDAAWKEFETKLAAACPS
jgi:hypothetical protein